MTLEYKGQTYYVTGESIYRDFSVIVGTVEEGCRLVEELDGMTEYVFNLTPCSNMKLVKRAIVIDDMNVTVRVILREMTEAELAKAELASLRSDMEEFALTASKTNAAKINSILAKGVS